MPLKFRSGAAHTSSAVRGSVAVGKPSDPMPEWARRYPERYSTQKVR